MNALRLVSGWSACSSAVRLSGHTTPLGGLCSWGDLVSLDPKSLLFSAGSGDGSLTGGVYLAFCSLSFRLQFPFSVGMIDSLAGEPCLHGRVAGGGVAIV